MFVLTFEYGVIINNYPKYLISLGNNKHTNIGRNNLFYYLISKFMHFDSFGPTFIFPKYMITTRLYFNVSNDNEKFDLSRLGTDYIINELCMHLKKECKGSYPKNYIFIEDHVLANFKGNKIDKSNLKCGYQHRTMFII